MNRRNRLPILVGALTLGWCAWGYDTGGSHVFFMTVAGLAALAVAVPRPLPDTTRAAVWSGLFLIVACLTADSARPIPADGLAADFRILGRTVSAFLGLGLTALFFRPRKTGVTVLAVAGLPMLMFILARNEPPRPLGFAALLVWGHIALVILLDQAQRLTAPRPAHRPAPTPGEIAARLTIPAAVLVAAIALSPPLAAGALALRQTLFGLVYRSVLPAYVPFRKTNEISLLQTLPSDFGRRVRVLLMIRAPHSPGYLRECVFTVYRFGRWLPVKPIRLLRPADGGAARAADGESVYELAAGSSGPTDDWQVDVLSPKGLGGFCLPGAAAALVCEGEPPRGEPNGIIAPDENLPKRFAVRVARPAPDAAYPGPDRPTDRIYLAIPTNLAGAVSKWIAECDGLSAAPTVPAAVACVEAYFATRFVYRMGVRFEAKPDPLVDFMTRRQGHCTLFASAAALMFRGRGIPSRVVGGYLGDTRHPWLDAWPIRERDAHAWVEVWDSAAARWRLVDPTPPSGRPEGYEEPGTLSLWRDLLADGWRRLVTGLGQAGLLETLATAVIAVVTLLGHALAQPAGLVALAALLAAWWWRRRRRHRAAAPDPEALLRLALTAEMHGVERRAVSGPLRRRPAESWADWLDRVEPDLPAPRRRELREWTEAYQSLRYRVKPETARAKEWLARARKAMR